VGATISLVARDLTYLREAHRNGNLVPVIGAGLSIAAAGLPSWGQLLERGLAYVESLAVDNSLRLKAARDLAAAGDLLNAFDILQKCLSEPTGSDYVASIEYQGFLNETFQDPVVKSTDLLQAVRDLSPRIAVTTNYDTLLEDFGATRDQKSLTWLQPAEIRTMIRAGSGVIHLHGRYDLPASVVLSQRDYDRVVNERDTKAISQALFHTGVLLFVGMSVDGADDPHLRSLLEEFKALTGRSGSDQHPHICLLRGRPTGREVARLRQLGIEAMSVGSDFEDLPRVLREVSAMERIAVGAGQARGLTAAVSNAGDLPEALREVAAFIADVVYEGREVRITYSELVATGASGAARLEARYVQPRNPTRSVFNYPLSIAAWALVEGRMIAWPQEIGMPCDFGLIERLGRLEAVLTAAESVSRVTHPELAQYIDVEKALDLLHNRRLQLKDFFQDWGSNQPTLRYQQFVSLPVPLVDSFGNQPTALQRGVFNIDSRAEAPLLSHRTRDLLALAAEYAELAYRLHS
jgi:hypothetical protein